MKKKTKGIKYDGGKAPRDLISEYALDELAKVLGEGAKKYSPWNWAEGLTFSRVIAAAERHIAAWKNREEIDPETRTSHLANAMCNLMFLLDFVAREMYELDDRRPIHTIRGYKKINKSKTKKKVKSKGKCK